MSPLLFYFRPKGFPRQSQKPNPLSKMENRFEVTSELDPLTVIASNAVLRRIQRLEGKDTDLLVLSGTGVGAGRGYTLVEVFVIPVAYYLALFTNRHTADSL